MNNIEIQLWIAEYTRHEDRHWGVTCADQVIRGLRKNTADFGMLGEEYLRQKEAL